MTIIKDKKSPYYYVRFSVKGRKVYESTRTTSKQDAKRYEAQRRTEILNEVLFNVRPKKTWKEASERWLLEMSGKRTIKQDSDKFIWLGKYLDNLDLTDITSDIIENIARQKELESSPSTANRTLALIRSVLNSALKKWEWVNTISYVRMRKEPSGRIRWLSLEEAERLLKELPQHLRLMAAFTLCTGLRANNVSQLRWTNIDIDKGILFIAGKEFKSGKNFSVPLNTRALEILKLTSKTSSYVFTFNDKPVVQCSTRAFRNALKRAEIEDFRWHDLRHTWASWHVQNGTSLQQLQILGGWASFDMVLRYAHLSKEEVRKSAENVRSVSFICV